LAGVDATQDGGVTAPLPGSAPTPDEQGAFALDLGFGTVAALTWLVATLATAFTLWIVVGLLGS
jgi:hypothetical protein